MSKPNYVVPDWSAPPTICALTTTRLSPGVSRHPFEQCNLGANTPDEEHRITTNRKLVTEDLNLHSPPLWLNQVHGDGINEITDALSPTSPTADAAYTHEKHRACAVLTADCLPIVLTNEAGSFVAALHCGWRGLAAQLIQKTIHRIASRSTVIAWIGPGIGPAAYAVSPALRDQFCTLNPCHQSAFAQRDNQVFANLACIAEQQLRASGVSCVHQSNLCTWSDSDRFYSYRRDGEKTGRMATLVWIED